MGLNWTDIPEKYRKHLKEKLTPEEVRKMFFGEFPMPTKTCEHCKYGLASFAAVRKDPQQRRCTSLKSPGYNQMMPLGATCDRFDWRKR